MTTSPRQERLASLRGILYSALASPYGLLLRTNNAKLARQELYTARRESGDASLDCLQFRFSPKGENMIEITKGAASPEAQALAELLDL